MAKSSRIFSSCVLASVALGPVLLGYFVARLPDLWRLAPALWGWAFLVGWFAIGRYLARESYHLAGLLAGVLPPIAGMVLFAQQFYLTSAEHRSQALSLLGQLYPMIAVSPSYQTMRVLGVTHFDSRIVVLVAFGIMVGVFLAGFVLGMRRISSEHQA